jgi:hypothetical protein
MPAPSGKESISAPTVTTDVTRKELPYRLRQQSLLGEFGRSALQTRDIAQILQRATELCAQGLETPFAKVLEYMPDDKLLLVRAGIGWASGTIGQVALGVDPESPAGYAFQTGQMVISNHLQEETRFRTPKLLSDHGIRRAINVLIARGGEGHLPFGVLEVDSPQSGQFDVADADFLAGFAGLLGIAIERQHADADDNNGAFQYPPFWLVYLAAKNRVPKASIKDCGAPDDRMSASCLQGIIPQRLIMRAAAWRQKLSIVRSGRRQAQFAGITQTVTIASTHAGQLRRAD